MGCVVEVKVIITFGRLLDEADGRSKHNNDLSDAVIVCRLRKYSFFSAVRVEIG